jgi:hypothetical protein
MRPGLSVLDEQQRYRTDGGELPEISKSRDSALTADSCRSRIQSIAAAPEAPLG